MDGRLKLFTLSRYVPYRPSGSTRHLKQCIIYVKYLVRNKHISFSFILSRNITWVSYKLKLKFVGRYLVPKHKVSNMSAIYNIEFETTIKVKSYFDVLN